MQQTQCHCFTCYCLKGFSDFSFVHTRQFSVDFSAANLSSVNIALIAVSTYCHMVTKVGMFHQPYDVVTHFVIYICYTVTGSPGSDLRPHGSWNTAGRVRYVYIEFYSM